MYISIISIFAILIYLRKINIIFIKLNQFKLKIEMNNTTLILNELFLFRIGSTWIIDGIYMFISLPVGMMGFILNIYSFSVLLKIKIKSTRLYEYLRIYCLNSAVICLISGWGFLAYSPRFFPYFSFSVFKFYRCYVYNFVGTTFYFFGNFLDIFISLDRITIFNQRAKFINKISLLKLCSSFFLISFLINFPTSLLFYPRSDAEFEQEANLNLNKFTYCGQTSILNSPIGSILTILVVFLRDFVTLMVEIAAGSASVFKIKLLIQPLMPIMIEKRSNSKDEMKMDDVFS
jgi:hypothetical protein